MDPRHLEGRRVIVGVSGSIAAYKAVLLVRLLARAGAEVRVLMTPAATAFVSPLTFSTLSKHAVLTSVVSEEGWNDHVALGLWADAYVIAPATANTIARLANGICDTILAAVYLSARCPVLLAPAMDIDMWAHPSTRANVARLEGYGDRLVPVGVGELASGLSGAGRLAEPEDIAAAVAEAVRGTGAPAGAPSRPETDRDPDREAPALAGTTVLVTAGPTHEPLDPVRFIGNRSSGRTGLALAAAFLDAGAEVELLLGPVEATPAHHPRLRVRAIQTARDLQAAASELWPRCDIGVLAAAVADYRPAEVAAEKIKKSADGAGLTLNLVRNPDVAADLGSRKLPGQILIGFALETDGAGGEAGQDEPGGESRGEAYARAKLERKRLDAIVLNRHRADAPAFGAVDNRVELLYADGRHERFGRESKSRIARRIVDAAAALHVLARAAR